MAMTIQQTIRPLQMKDLTSVLGLLNTYSERLIGLPATEQGFLEQQWQSLNFETSWVAEVDHNIVGYLVLYPKGDFTAFTIWGRVHPDYAHQQLANQLLDIAEQTAQQLATEHKITTFSLNNRISQKDSAMVQLLTERGYQLVRQFWQMGIELQDFYPPVPLPAELRIRTFQPNQDEMPLHQTYNEVLMDHWGFSPMPYTFWHRMLTQPANNYDPSLWFLAVDKNDQIAGYMLCNPHQTHIPDMGYAPQNGWVHDMGVIRSWRGQKVGRALMIHGLNEFFRRGTRTVQLGVDAENPTGATHLYHNLGMNIRLTFNTYQKVVS